jgi:hypothetical protein
LIDMADDGVNPFLRLFLLNYDPSGI